MPFRPQPDVLLYRPAACHLQHPIRHGLPLVLLLFATLILGMGRPDDATSHSLRLRGDQVVPAVNSPALAVGSITVEADGSVRGNLSTSGLIATQAAIRAAEVGSNGPVVIDLVSTGSTWVVPAGAILTPEQLAQYRAGGLYVDVSSDAHPQGEIRAQLEP